MVKTLSPLELVREAAAIFDSPKIDLRQSARKAWRGGFASGGEWMREALWLLRDQQVTYRPVNFGMLGIVKYGMAFAIALLAGGLAVRLNVAASLVVTLLTFYVIESRLVFLFPLSIDGVADLFGHSRILLKRAGGQWTVLMTVLTFASVMLFGGFFGRGFVRSWCLGCLAVLLWYERLRTPDIEAEKRSLLEIAHSESLTVRQEAVTVFGGDQSLRIAYLSDLHLQRRSGVLVDEIVEVAHRATPDLILLGGDLVDNKAGLPLLENVVTRLSKIAPVWAVEGNHDRYVGSSLVQRAVEISAGNWLGQNTVLLQLPERPAFYLDGSCRSEPSLHPRLLCLHEPDCFLQAVEANYALVLAGHLHGGQCVIFEHQGRFYPGAWFNRWTGGRFKRGNTTMLVSRGISDTVPVRWNCPREIILCEIH